MAVRLCVAVLRWLLRLYPPRFRRRHGAHLLQDSAELLRAARRRRGLPGLVLMWLRLLRDVAVGGPAERAARRRRPGHRIPTTEKRLPVLDQLSQDLGFGRRAIARRPGTTLLAVLILALGIGASVSMFSVLDAVILRPLPYPQADRLASIYTTIPDWLEHESLAAGWNRTKWEYEEFQEWRTRQTSFEAAALVEDVSATLAGEGPAVRIRVGLAGLELFPLLGVTPDRGRFFVPDDELEGGVVVVSNDFWRTRLGGDEDVVGRTVTLDGGTFTIVGVLPPGFEVSGYPAEVWLPIFGNRPGGHFPGNTGDMNHVFRALGTLRPGVSPETAAEEAGRLLAAIGGEDHVAEHGANVVPRLVDETRSVRSPLLLLMGAVLLLLLVACANVATFLLGQAVDRRQEIAVRSAVGAGSCRIVRQLLTESLVLALLAGGTGLLLARLGISALVGLAPATLPRLDAVSLDLRAAAFAIGVSSLAGLLFGLAPALSLGRADLARTLGAARAGSAGRSRLQAGMVVAEMAVATVLLVGAGLLTRSFLTLNSVDPGFRTEGVILLQLAYDYESYSDDEGEFRDGAVRARVQEIVDAVAALPGIERAAVAEGLPFTGFSATNDVRPEGVEPPPGEFFLGHRRFVTPGYFEVMGIPLLEGRYLEPRDNRPDAASVVVVSETLARRFWPGESAVGKTLGWWDQESVIVGVVGPVRHEGLDAPPQMQFYAAQAPFRMSGGSIVARTGGDEATATAMAAVRAVVRREAPELPVTRLTSMGELVAGSLDAARFRTRLMAGFALMAALLSALGLYGVTSRAVAGRAREIGIRVALGAEWGRVVGLVLRDGVRLALVGAAAGLAVALAGTRLLQGFLYGVEPNDPLTLALIVGLVAGMGVLATVVPSLRASRVDPVEVLRSE